MLYIYFVELIVSNVIPFISIQQAESLCFVLNNVKANKLITKALSMNFAYLCADISICAHFIFINIREQAMISL